MLVFGGIKRRVLEGKGERTSVERVGEKAKWYFSSILRAECRWLVLLLVKKSILCSRRLSGDKPMLTFISLAGSYAKTGITSLPMVARRHHRIQPIERRNSYSNALAMIRSDSIRLPLTLPFRLYNQRGTSTCTDLDSPFASAHT